MNRRDARRHRGRNRQVSRALPAKAVEALSERRISEYETLIPNPETRKALEHWGGKIDEPLFVYFIQAADGAVKIGKAHDPLGRLRDLQCGNPRQLYVRHVVLAAIDLEKNLHSSWGRVCHVRGEWFGAGCEEVILRVAEEVSTRQLLLSESGEFSLGEITDVAAVDLSPFWLKEKAA